MGVTVTGEGFAVYANRSARGTSYATIVVQNANGLQGRFELSSRVYDLSTLPSGPTNAFRFVAVCDVLNFGAGKESRQVLSAQDFKVTPLTTK